MRAEWISHKGKKILYLKFGGLTKEEQVELIKESTNLLVETKSNDNLTLIDVTDMFASDEFISTSKENSKITAQYVKKSAILGIVGIKKVLLNAVNAVTNKPRKPFDRMEEAKDWLVE